MGILILHLLKLKTYSNLYYGESPPQIKMHWNMKMKIHKQWFFSNFQLYFNFYYEHLISKQKYMFIIILIKAAFLAQLCVFSNLAFICHFLNSEKI